MNLDELQDRIACREDLHTEFGEWRVHADDLAATLTAFANTGGGRLIVGVNKDRRIAGVTDADRAMQGLDSIAYQSCEPRMCCAARQSISSLADWGWSPAWAAACSG
jgi:ATP-dependent DNA helicase RecG